MEKIKVLVDWCERNFAAVTECEALGGVVVATAKDYDTLMDELKQGVALHVEGMMKDGDEVPAWLAAGSYGWDIELGTAALLRKAETFTTMAAISRATGINQQQLSHYANGLRKPRPEQRERIAAGIHHIGQQLLSVV